MKRNLLILPLLLLMLIACGEALDTVLNIDTTLESSEEIATGDNSNEAASPLETGAASGSLIESQFVGLWGATSPDETLVFFEIESGGRVNVYSHQSDPVSGDACYGIEEGVEHLRRTEAGYAYHNPDIPAGDYILMHLYLEAGNLWFRALEGHADFGVVEGDLLFFGYALSSPPSVQLMREMRCAEVADQAEPDEEYVPYGDVEAQFTGLWTSAGHRQEYLEIGADGRITFYSPDEQLSPSRSKCFAVDRNYEYLIPTEQGYLYRKVGVRAGEEILVEPYFEFDELWFYVLQDDREEFGLFRGDELFFGEPAPSAPPVQLMNSMDCDSLGVADIRSDIDASVMLEPTQLSGVWAYLSNEIGFMFVEVTADGVVNTFTPNLNLYTSQLCFDVRDGARTLTRTQSAYLYASHAWDANQTARVEPYLKQGKIWLRVVDDDNALGLRAGDELYFAYRLADPPPVEGIRAMSCSR